MPTPRRPRTGSRSMIAQGKRQVVWWATAAELERLDAAAAHLGLSRAEFVRRASLRAAELAPGISPPGAGIGAPGANQEPRAKKCSTRT